MNSLNTPSLSLRALPSHADQKGVVLLMALIMLAIIAITSSLALKSATVGDQISNNLRGQKLAQQAAEIGLRWCEAQVIQGTFTKVQPAADIPNAADSENWQKADSWENANIIQIVPADAISKVQGGINFPIPPQCMAQEVSTPLLGVSDGDVSLEQASSRMVRVTVRAFSPDYSRTTTDGTGSETWIVSTLVNPI